MPSNEISHFQASRNVKGNLHVDVLVANAVI